MTSTIDALRHESHERTHTTETTLGPGRSPLDGPSLRASPPHESTPEDKAQRGRRRDAAPTDKLGRRRSGRRALGAGAGARGAAAISSNPEAAAGRLENRSHTRQRHGETNDDLGHYWGRLLRLCRRLVPSLITSATRDRSRSNNSWFAGSPTTPTVSGEHALV